VKDAQITQDRVLADFFRRGRAIMDHEPDRWSRFSAVLEWLFVRIGVLPSSPCHSPCRVHGSFGAISDK